MEKLLFTVYYFIIVIMSLGSQMVSALDSGRSMDVALLAGVIVICSWTKHFTLTVVLSICRRINEHRQTVRAIKPKRWSGEGRGRVACPRQGA